jgi:hypothetical protein
MEVKSRKAIKVIGNKRNIVIQTSNAARVLQAFRKIGTAPNTIQIE